MATRRKPIETVDIPKWVNSPHREYMKEVNRRKNRNFTVFTILAVIGALSIAKWLITFLVYLWNF